jgi:hypothetical protein
MSQIYEIVRRAGRIPLDELVLRSSQPPEAVNRELRMLMAEGWVQLKGDLPEAADMAERAGDTIVMLSSKGISANTA